jgi:hypothetical protein
LGFGPVASKRLTAKEIFVKLLNAVLGVVLLAGAAWAGAVDGKWAAERKIERDGQSMTIKQTMDLKTDGTKLTGTMTVAFGDMDPMSMDVKDGKVDGNNFSFTTTMSTPNGDFKMTYKGTVDGDAMKGTVEREGAEPRPFEAKRK